MIRILVIVVIGLALVAQSAFIITEGDQGIVLQFGKPMRTIQEPGLYFKYPFIQDLTIFNKRILVAEARPAEYITLDKSASRWIQSPGGRSSTR